MPLAAGTRLGPYEIVAPLGAGGMAEVYRARDTRLGREIAVRVLPNRRMLERGDRLPVDANGPSRTRLQRCAFAHRDHLDLPRGWHPQAPASHAAAAGGHPG